MPSYQIHNGRVTEIPDIVVSESVETHDDVSLSVIVEPGVTLTTHGRLQGSVQVREGGRLDAFEDVTGSVSVEAGATATFHATISGSVRASRGAEVTLTETSRVHGSMQIDGTLVDLRNARSAQARSTPPSDG